MVAKPQSAFRVGVTPDFYVDAKGRFESILDQKLTGVVPAKVIDGILA